MRRAICLGLVLACGSLAVTAAAYQNFQTPRPENVRIENIQRVRDNLYVIGGADPRDTGTFTGGTTAVFVTDSGVVLVDTKFPGWGQVILNQVKKVTDKPVTMIINTHTHVDHAGSNNEFPSTVEIVTHVNTKAHMSKTSCEPVVNCEAFKGANAKFLPKKTFQDRLSLLSGKDRIDLYYFGRGHTDGDALVVFPALRAMHTGDLYQLKWLPHIDPGSGGSGRALPDTLAKAVATIKNVDTIIPGHNPVGTWADLVENVDVLRDFRNTVEAGVKAGKSADEIANAYRLPAKYKGYSTTPDRVKANVQMIVDELTKTFPQ